MKKILLIIVFIALIISLHAQVYDSFSDGNISENPAWFGDTNDFVVNNSGELQLNASASGTKYLSTASQTFGTMEWQFRIKLNFSPSDNNYCRFYLSADKADLQDTSLNGYYLRFGESGSNDAIKLYRQQGTSNSLLATGTLGQIANAFDLDIKVTYDSNNTFIIQTSEANLNNWNTSCFYTTSFDNQLNYIGLICTYTSSNSTKFYFDNIYHGHILYDTISPSVSTYTLYYNNRTALSIAFSENIDTSNISTNNFTINNIEHPIQVIFDNPSSLTLQFNDSLPLNTTLNLRISHIKDLNNNELIDTNFDFIYYIAQPFDVIINEIMADPSPTVGLPEYEYIELYNRNNFDISLYGWKLKIGTSTKIFPNVIIPARQYLIICASACKSLFESYGQVASFSSVQITDAGQSILLIDTNEQIIHFVNFTDSWYHNSQKKNGGWSLEMIDFNNPCAEEDNWTASNHPLGGTPGNINSVFSNNPDDELPVIDHIFAQSDTVISVYFSEKILNKPFAQNHTFALSDNLTINQIIFNEEEWNCINISFSPALQVGVTYQLSILDSIVDCVGNSIVYPQSYPFGYAVRAEENDVIINEILFNPKDDGVDFVEIYNRSDRLINLKELRIANLKNGSMDTGYVVSTKGQSLSPQQYLVITTRSEKVKEQYFCPNDDNFIDMNAFPAFNNESGCAILLSGGEIVDRFDYREDMHYKMLKSVDGVSLERINFERPTQDAGNWHSAAATVGFATPGYKNSAFSENLEAEDEISIYPEIFSPDNDGYNDILQIKYQFAEPGNRLTIDIYNVHGQRILNLVNNELVDTEGYFTWDGSIENLIKAPIGNYIIIAKCWKTDGSVKKIKKSCTLAIKF